MGPYNGPAGPAWSQSVTRPHLDHQCHHCSPSGAPAPSSPRAAAACPARVPSERVPRRHLLAAPLALAAAATTSDLRRSDRWLVVCVHRGAQLSSSAPPSQAAAPPAGPPPKCMMRHSERAAAAREIEREIECSSAAKSRGDAGGDGADGCPPVGAQGWRWRCRWRTRRSRVGGRSP